MKKILILIVKAVVQYAVSAGMVALGRAISESVKRELLEKSLEQF